MTDEDLRDLLLDTKVIAVVGLSANPDRPSNQVAWYLHHQGYRLFGVNPRCPAPEVFGVPVLPSLDQVPEPIDIVDVFRRPEHTPEAARGAVAGPDLVLRFRSFDDFVDIGAERADPRMLVLRGRLQPKGKLRLLAKLPKIFPG